jgi:hypothetical protein
MMIDVKELRIGNLVNSLGIDYDAGENKIHDPEEDEIVAVDLDVIKDCIGQPNHYAAISLTPEWLEKCGFKETSRSKYFNEIDWYGPNDMIIQSNG